MNGLLSQIITFLADPRGNLFYHYALALSIGIALYVAFNNWRSSEFPQVKRTMLGLALLLLAQFLMFGFSALGWEGLINPTASLPPLDRLHLLQHHYDRLVVEFSRTQPDCGFCDSAGYDRPGRGHLHQPTDLE